MRVSMRDEVKKKIEAMADNHTLSNQHEGYDESLYSVGFSDGYKGGLTPFAEQAEKLREALKFYIERYGKNSTVAIQALAEYDAFIGGEE